MRKLLILTLVVMGLLFGAEPIAKKTFWDKIQVLDYIRSCPQYIIVDGGAGSVDTTTYTSVTLLEKATIPWISVTVRDTVESTSDTALFRVCFDNRQVLRKSAAQFKLGKTDSSRTYRWDVNHEVSGRLRIKLSRAAVTEGTYFWTIPYIVKDNKP